MTMETKKEWLARMEKIHPGCSCGHRYVNHGMKDRKVEVDKVKKMMRFDMACWSRGCKCVNYQEIGGPQAL